MRCQNGTCGLTVWIPASPPPLLGLARPSRRGILPASPGNGRGLKRELKRARRRTRSQQRPGRPSAFRGLVFRPTDPPPRHPAWAPRGREMVIPCMHTTQRPATDERSGIQETLRQAGAGARDASFSPALPDPNDPIVFGIFRAQRLADPLGRAVTDRFYGNASAPPTPETSQR